MDDRLEDEGFLRKLYQVEGKSCAAIARILGVTSKTVWNKLKKFNIPTRSPKDSMLRRHRKKRVDGINVTELLTDDINLDTEPLSPGEVKKRMEKYQRERNGKRKKAERERISKQIMKERKERLLYHGEDEAAQQLAEAQREFETPMNQRKRKSGLKD